MTDPAETARLVKALGTQGSRLTQHEAALTDMGNNLQAMFTQQKDLVAAVQSLTNQLATLTTSPDPAPDPLRQPPPPLQPAHHSEPRIPAPERYNGDLGTCGPFLTQCSLLFEHQPHSFTNDRARIAYHIKLLKGPALEWASAVWDQQTPICDSYPNFVLEMRNIFDHPVRGRDAAKRLQTLRQGSRSVAEMAIDFRTLAIQSGWNDKALQGCFQQFLCDTIKDELVSRDEPADLEGLIALSIRIDNRLRERRRERSVRSPQASVSSSPAPPRFPSIHFPEPRRDCPRVSEPEPMQLGRAHLSPEERARRLRSNSCMYCGLVGHFVSVCPSKRAGSVVIREVRSSQVASRSLPPPSSSRPLLDAALLWRTQSHVFSALIDSGADESFIDEEVARKMGIEMEPLDSPLLAKALNGHAFSPD